MRSTQTTETAPATGRAAQALDGAQPPVPEPQDAGGRILLAAPRGYCAGVDRAVDAVEQALAHYGAPIYVRKEIVGRPHQRRDAR